MLVVCPKCFTQYVISNEIKIPEGQKFHCSACGNFFTLKSERQTGFYGDDAASEDEEIPTVSAVMNETQTDETPSNDFSAPVPVTVESESKVAAKNESNRAENKDPVVSDADSLTLLANETPRASDRLDTLPEAFKPVATKQKKTSAFGALFWLFVAGAICSGAVYVLKQYPLRKLTEELITAKLDKDYVSKAQKEVASSAENTADQEAVQPTSAVADDKNESKNTADKPMYIPPARLDKPIITVDEVLAREARQKEQKPSVEKESAADVRSDKQLMPVAPLGTTQQMEQAPKPTQLMAQQAKAQQSTTPSTVSEAPAETVESAPLSQAQETARLLDEQLEQGAAADRLENEVATLATEKNLTQASRSDFDEPVPAESNAAAENASQAPAEAAENVAQENASEASVLEAATASQSTENNQVPVNNDTAQQPDNAPIMPTSDSVAAAAPSENVPLFAVDEPEPAKQINTDEANRILKIQDIAYEISQNEAGVMRLLIKGNVANTELTKVVIPQLKAVVYDQNDTPVARKRIILSQPEIDGNSVQSFFSSVVPAPEQVSHVEVVFDE